MPPAFAFRQARPDDAPCLSALATQVYLDTYATAGVNHALAQEVLRMFSVDALARRLVQPGVQIRLAECDGHLVGFVDLVSDTVCPVAGIAGLEVCRLYIQRPFHGRGLGRALLAWAEAQARADRRPQVWLTAWSGNERALAFYERAGDRLVGHTQHVIDGVAHPNHVFARHIGDG